MLTPDRATAIYLEYKAYPQQSMRQLGQRYGVNANTIRRVITAQHRYTRGLEPLYTPPQHHTDSGPGTDYEF